MTLHTTVRPRPTGRLAKLLLLGTVLAVVTFIAVMPAAHADTRTFNDSTTDQTSYMGIRWVEVQNGWRAGGSWHRNLKIITRVGNFPPVPDFAGTTYIFIDTRPENPGPEYRLRMAQDIGLWRVEGWHDHGTSVPWGCGPGRFGYDFSYPLTDDRVVAWIKPACIGGAGKVRVSVHTTVLNRPKQQDWAKARNAFYPWVLR
jgi:hypothetical protein